MRMLSFWGFIIKYVKCKQEKKNNTILSENILGKFVFHETKKVNSLRFNCEPFEKFRCFVSGILLVNMLNLSVKKLKKYNFKQKPLGKFVFHETKKLNNLRFLIIVNHFTAVMGNVVNNLFLGF